MELCALLPLGCSAHSFDSLMEHRFLGKGVLQHCFLVGFLGNLFNKTILVAAAKVSDSYSHKRGNL